MITPDFVQRMLRASLRRHRLALQLAETLPLSLRYGGDHGRTPLAQAFAKGLEEDLLWLRRLEAYPSVTAPEPLTPCAFADWDEGRRLRQDTDARLMVWASALTQAELSGWLFWVSPDTPERQMQAMEVYVLELVAGQIKSQGEIGLLLQAEGLPWPGSDLAEDEIF